MLNPSFFFWYSELLVETQLMSPKQNTSIFEEDEQLAK
jgi:hypothetical protein